MPVASRAVRYVEWWADKSDAHVASWTAWNSRVQRSSQWPISAPLFRRNRCIDPGVLGFRRHASMNAWRRPSRPSLSPRIAAIAAKEARSSRSPSRVRACRLSRPRL